MMTMRPPALPPVQHCGPPAVPPQAIYSAEPASVRPARRYVREAAAHQEPGVTADTLDTLELLTSELVTNAIRYGAEPGDSVRVVVAAEPGRCRIDVHDPQHHRARALPASAERGRGLILVKALAARWGVDAREASKSVWAVVTWQSAEPMYRALLDHTATCLACRAGASCSAEVQLGRRWRESRRETDRGAICPKCKRIWCGGCEASVS